VVVPVGYAQVTIGFTGSAVPTGAAVTFGLDISAGPATPALVAVAVDNAYFSSGIPTQIATGANETSILVKFGPDNLGPSAEIATNNPGTGGSSGVPNTAWLVRKVTALGGRAGRGRFFLPGVPEAEVDPSGIIDSSSVTGMQTAVDDFFSELAVGGMIPVLLHSEGSPLNIPTEITSHEVQSLAATQRRRLRR
jgi:hypothetical protein